MKNFKKSTFRNPRSKSCMSFRKKIGRIPAGSPCVIPIEIAEEIFWETFLEFLRQCINGWWNCAMKFLLLFLQKSKNFHRNWIPLGGSETSTRFCLSTIAEISQAYSDGISADIALRSPQGSSYNTSQNFLSLPVFFLSSFGLLWVGLCKPWTFPLFTLFLWNYI